MAVVRDQRRRFFVVDNAVLDMGLSPYAVTLYCWLARFADPKGRSFPSVGTLAERMGVSRPTIRKAIGELERAGLIEVRDGVYRSHQFILLEVATTLPPSEEVATTLPGVATTLPGDGNVVVSNNTHSTRPTDKDFMTVVRQQVTPAAWEMYFQQARFEVLGDVVVVEVDATRVEWMRVRALKILERAASVWGLSVELRER